MALFCCKDMPVRCLVAKKRRNKYETKRAGQQGMRKEGIRKTEQNKHDAAPLVPFIILMLDLVKRGRCEKFIAQHYSHEFILMYQFVSQVSLSETQTNIYICEWKRNDEIVGYTTAKRCTNRHPNVRTHNGQLRIPRPGQVKIAMFSIFVFSTDKFDTWGESMKT